MPLIEAITAAPIPGVPSEIVFVPEGDHHIYPQSHPDGIRVNLPWERGPEIAASLQEQLERLQRNNVRPFFDFDHNPKGPNSGYPTAFWYEDGKGIICSVDWSGAGRAAIEGRDYAYFSPRVDLDPTNSVPSSLPEDGVLGGLVNRPAFKNIPRIAAGDAGRRDPHAGLSGVDLLAACLADDAARADRAKAARRNHDDARLLAGLSGRDLLGAALTLEAAVTPAERAKAEKEVKEMRKHYEAKSPLEEIHQLVDAKREAAPDLPEEEARILVFEKRPELYAEWLKHLRKVDQETAAPLSAIDRLAASIAEGK